MAETTGAMEHEDHLTAKGRATRERIVGAAAELIYDRGVAGTSLDDVGAAAGVGKSQLYHYFSDKAALVQAVILVQTERVLTLQVGLDSWDSWRAWRDLVVELQRQRRFRSGCPLGSLASELADRDEMARDRLADSFGRWEQAFRTGLTTMHERGQLDAGADPGALALSILASLQGGLLLSRTRRDDAPLEVALDGALAQLHTYRAGSPSGPVS